LEKENKELKKTLDESEKSLKQKLSTLAVEMEQLKLKLKERSKTPEVRKQSCLNLTGFI